MILGFLMIGIIFCAILAITAKRLLSSAIWLAGVSALSAMVFYLLNAREVAVIELSVGVGLVTVLFVFAISIAGDEVMDAKSLVPVALAWILALGAVILLGWMALPELHTAEKITELTSTDILWQQRGLDVLVQVVLIFAGVLSVLGLLSERVRSPDGKQKGGG
jgi:uncharacterized MnhB-related membrane protein